ncbi:Trp biosynthesis-associated membrane protein [Nonomuraea sp. NPDC059194]|uniref:Trp biosynthesis-associated membrane protein n=1 Tax=Nonomuraea sp. NPDC059194 TaxID=3346764 RepID=UPI0036A8E6F9
MKPGVKRELGAWLVLCAAGAGLPLLAAGRVWTSVTYGAAAPVELTGGDLAPAGQPLALAALAAMVALFATKGVWRRIVGGVLALCGAGVALLAWQGADDSAARELAARRNPVGAATQEVTALVHAVWPYVALAGGALLVAAGVLAAVRGTGWASMSGRYDRPRTDAGPRDDKSLWEAIDRGDDPTEER